MRRLEVFGSKMIIRRTFDEDMEAQMGKMGLVAPDIVKDKLRDKANDGIVEYCGSLVEYYKVGDRVGFVGFSGIDAYDKEFPETKGVLIINEEEILCKIIDE